MSDGESIDDDFQLSLHTIPVELFLHICTFLNGKQIIQSLKSVCRSFYDTLSDDVVWRTWLKRRWPRLPTSNICYKDDVFPSQSVCLQVDRGLELWSKKEVNCKKWICNSVHISTVETVKLLQGGKLGISGSRDRSIAVWDTSEQLINVELKNGAHEGWIWDICPSPEPQQFFSCAWDSSVKLWTLDQQLLQVAEFKCKAAALTVVSRPGLVATGLFTAKVELFDPRSGSVGSYSSHNRSIMALAFLRDFIISASEDHTMSVWDIKAGKPFKSGIQVSKKGHPMTLSYDEGNLLFVGDTESRLHIFNTVDDSFSLVDTFDLGHKPRGGIMSMWHNTDFIMTGSKDATVRIHTATRPPHLIDQLSSDSGGITSNIQIDNFSTSWNNGLAFCALIHHFCPDAFDYDKLIPEQRRHNFELAFRVAEEQADIAPLLDVDDMVAMRRPDWKCVFTYVQSIYRRFHSTPEAVRC